MKQKTILATIFLAFACGYLVNAQEMRFFEGTWAEAKTEALKRKKFIFVDAHTAWCGPCKWMANVTFKKKEVGAFYNANFINYKLDVEKGEGPAFAKEYTVPSYPTFFFFDSKGELVHKTVGSKPAEKFILDGENAINPKKQYFQLKKRYDGRERSAELLYEYALASAASGAQGPVTYQIFQEYLKTQKDSELTSKRNWEIISTLVNYPNDPIFEVVLKRKNEFYKVEKPERIDDYVVNVLLDEIFDISSRNDSTALFKLKDRIEEYNPQNLDKHLTLIDYIFLTYNNGSENDELFYQTAIKYIDKYAPQDANELNNAASVFYQKFFERPRLQKALEWIERSIKIEKNSFNTETYACLLYKLGRKDEAFKWVKESNDIANAVGASLNPEAAGILNEGYETGKLKR